MKYLTILIATSALLAGCEYTISDAATRVRYAFQKAEISSFLLSENETTTITVAPDHWPEGCKKGEGYQLILKPYQGNKQVASGDIVVDCFGENGYHTGFGSEDIVIAQEMTIKKKSGEKVQITLRKSQPGLEIIELK